MRIQSETKIIHNHFVIILSPKCWIHSPWISNVLRIRSPKTLIWFWKNKSFWGLKVGKYARSSSQRFSPKHNPNSPETLKSLSSKEQERSKSGIKQIEESATHVCIQWEIQEVLRKVGRSLQCISHSSPRLCCATEKTCTNVWALSTLILNKESRKQNVYGWAEVLFALLFQMHIDDRM